MGWQVTVYGITCIMESLSAYQVTILLRGAYSIVTHQLVNDTLRLSKCKQASGFRRNSSYLIPPYVVFTFQLIGAHIGVTITHHKQYRQRQLYSWDV